MFPVFISFILLSQPAAGDGKGESEGQIQQNTLVYDFF